MYKTLYHGENSMSNEEGLISIENVLSGKDTEIEFIIELIKKEKEK